MSTTGRKQDHVAAAAIACSLLLAACQTTVTTNDGRPPPPRPRAAPEVPTAARANAMALRVAAKGTDTDANGYPDAIPVEVFLFARPHPMPMTEDGAFVFTLTSIGSDDALAEWRYETERVQQARMRSGLFGEGYFFRLSLLESGGDVRPLVAVNLSCRFEPADGSGPVESAGLYSVQVGRKSPRTP